MIRFFRMLEDVFAAAAFAECGDFETARSFMKKDSKPQTRADGRKASRPRPRVSV